MAKQSYWPIIGHQSITTLLDHLLANPYLHNHAFLFCGQRHLGKTLVAEEFIKRLLKLADEVSIWQQPDVHLLERLPDKTEIGIEQVRVWQKDLILRPFAAPYKVGIIQEAEYLNQESSNALLKILEEPSGQTLIIIIVNDGQKILPTIRSRARQRKLLMVCWRLAVCLS
ncbi:MAG: hypothetical protein NTV81_01400 [Candidatus Komeilibacteria bacterium]|nr:hypothetical protein [Candidatus Komeilibacteria bacterium]